MDDLIDALLFPKQRQERSPDPGPFAEHRSYKPTMPRADAYNILCGMNGKLEMALIAAFKQVAITR